MKNNNNKNIFSFFLRDIKKDPLKFALLLVTIISTVAAIWFYYSSLQIESGKKQMEKEKSELERPIIIAPDKRVKGGAIADLSFFVKNPTMNLNYFYENGSCLPKDPQFFQKPQITTSTIKEVEKSPSITPTFEIPLEMPNGYIIPPEASLTLSCTNNFIVNPEKDTLTSIKVCVKIKNINEPICDEMGVTILKS